MISKQLIIEYSKKEVKFIFKMVNPVTHFKGQW